jgi:hypothetical protein
MEWLVPLAFGIFLTGWVWIAVEAIRNAYRK